MGGVPLSGIPVGVMSKKPLLWAQFTFSFTSIIGNKDKIKYSFKNQVPDNAWPINNRD
jgi:hypothetical protein